MRVKRPRTVTATVLPRAGRHDGEQAMVTSAGVTAANPPLASLTARHITRLVILSHGAPGTNDVGSAEASSAPSRAALASVIVE